VLGLRGVTLKTTCGEERRQARKSRGESKMQLHVLIEGQDAAGRACRAFNK
jgi:hypothetical protein